MNDPKLNIVSLRYKPGGMTEEQIDAFNDRLGEAVIADGRFLVGTSKMGARTIFRPAFSNWRTRTEDIDEFIEVLQDLGDNVRKNHRFQQEVEQ